MKDTSLITFDFETYRDDAYSLDKLTTEQYIHDERFEVICVAVKFNDEPTECFSGTFEETKKFLEKFDWSNSYALAHNMKFDGAILTWKFGIQPQHYLDTMLMGQAIHGTLFSTSLDSMANAYLEKQKGNYVNEVVGLRRKYFTADQMDNFKQYCINDVNLTSDLFWKLRDTFSEVEFGLINVTLSMYLNPNFKLDTAALKERLVEVVQEKNLLLLKAGVPREVVSSNDKFKAELKKYGVPELHSYAKSNDKFMALANHSNEKVRNLFAARVKCKSTLEETRIESFIGIAERNKFFPIPLRYYEAHTGRWAGEDKLNVQNLPSKGEAKTLKKSLTAPNGYVVIEADSSQIEARVLAWLSGQDDVLNNFKTGKCNYKYMASKIFDKPVSKITADERKVGKVAVLSCMYGIGGKAFHKTLLSWDIKMPESDAHEIVKIYRTSNNMVRDLWYQADTYLRNLCFHKTGSPIGKADVIKPHKYGIKLPNGMGIYYLDVEHNYNVSSNRDEFYYLRKYRDKAKTKIYGAKIIENVTQALARQIVGYQIYQIHFKYKVALCVHDSVVCIVPVKDKDEATEFIRMAMKKVPDWAKGLPVDCEVKVGENYGELYAA